MYIVSALCWRSLTCFCPFCGSPNYLVFTLKLSHYLASHDDIRMSSCEAMLFFHLLFCLNLFSANGFTFLTKENLGIKLFAITGKLHGRHSSRFGEKPLSSHILTWTDKEPPCSAGHGWTRGRGCHWLRLNASTRQPLETGQGTYSVFAYVPTLFGCRQSPTNHMWDEAQPTLYLHQSSVLYLSSSSLHIKWKIRVNWT